jgi:hypothetical protein
MKTIRMGWALNVARIIKKTNAYGVLVGKSERKIPLRKTKT